MLDDLEWPPLQQRRAESRLALFHRIVNGTVDISIWISTEFKNTRSLNYSQGV